MKNKIISARRLNTKAIIKQIRRKRGTFKCWLDINGLREHEQIARELIANRYLWPKSPTSQKILKALKKDGFIN